MIAGALFACGITFFVPNMIGLMSERFPKAGSLGIVLLIGMGFVGGGASNAIMGEIADSYLPEALDEQQTVRILETVEERFPAYLEKAREAQGDPEAIAELGYRAADIQNVLEQTREALSYYRENRELQGVAAGNALRALIDSRVPGEEDLIQQASETLRPADNYGGRMAFRWVAPIAVGSGIVFLIWFVRDRRKGGYRVERLEKREE
jgi:hypothetical protein